MKKINIVYWISTGLLAAFMLMSAIQGIINTPDSIDLMCTQLHYPLYFPRFLGIAKLLGVVAILVPGYPRIREWAYAGFTFDLIAATYSIIAVAGLKINSAFMIVFFVVLACSYIFYHKKLKAGGVKHATV